MHVWASLPRDNATRFKDLKSKSNVAIFSLNISKVVRFQIKKFSLFMAIVLFPKSWWYSLFCFHGNQFLTEFWKRQKNLLRIYVCRFYVLYWFFIKHQLNLVQTYLENSNFSLKKNKNNENNISDKWLYYHIILWLYLRVPKHEEVFFHCQILHKILVKTKLIFLLIIFLEMS